MRVLVTRPKQDAAATCRALELAGHDALSAPLFEVVALPHVTGTVFDAVLATSAHAPRLLDRSIARQAAHLPFFTVGDATADAARRAGFTDVRSARGDGADLAALIHRELPHGSSMLYLAGIPRRDSAIQALQNTFALSTLEVYQTLAADHLPELAASALEADALDAVMHFSPRAAQVFLDLTEKAGLSGACGHLLHVCISSATHDPRLVRHRIAPEPTLAAMVEALKTA
jgi:uroporphyrinogen-III synthase